MRRDKIQKRQAFYRNVRQEERHWYVVQQDAADTRVKLQTTVVSKGSKKYICFSALKKTYLEFLDLTGLCEHLSISDHLLCLVPFGRGRNAKRKFFTVKADRQVTGLLSSAQRADVSERQHPANQSSRTG